MRVLAVCCSSVRGHIFDKLRCCGIRTTAVNGAPWSCLVDKQIYIYIQYFLLKHIVCVLEAQQTS